jgi:hypothetical protein
MHDQWVSSMAIRSDKDKAISDVVAAGIENWERATRQATALVKATDAKVISELEACFGFSQQEAVTHFLEQTEWGVQNFPQYQGRQGSPQERIKVLLSRWDDWENS